MVLAILIAPFSMSQSPIVEKEGTPAGWSDDVNLSQNQLNSNEPAIATNQNNIHVVWFYNPGPTRDIVYKKSIDGGRTWGSMVTLDNSTFLDWNPDIGISGNNIHVVWENDLSPKGVYYRNSIDNGETWNTTKRMNPIDKTAGSPHVFVNQSNVHIIWQDFSTGVNGQIFYRRSLDGGITFDNGQGVDADRQITFSPSTIGQVDITGQGSNLSVIWCDERNGNFQVYWMISKDNGYTWEDGLGHVNTDRKISNSSDVCMDPAFAMDGSNISILWSEQSWPGPTYCLYYRNSSDMGTAWGNIQLLTGPTPLSSWPDISLHKNNIHIVWNDRRDDGTNEQIYYKNSTDGGTSWCSDLRLTFNNATRSSRPKIALQNDTRHIVWHNWYGSNLRDVFYKRYPDFPDTSPPSHSNETPFPDSYKDAPGTNVSVHVTDPSGVNESTIQLYVNGSSVPYTLMPITDGYNVSYDSGGFGPGVVTCRIVADDNLSNHLDYTWNFMVLAIYNSQLREGWNLISVPLEQVDTSISEVLKDIEGKWDCIQVYDATDSDHWKTNLTYRPEQLNDLNSLNHKIGFWINVTEPNVNLTVRGNISTYTIIPLYAGWNLVGYPTQTTETVANALWGTGADGVEVFDPTDAYRLKEVGSTYIMKPGEGYWVHVVADSVWVVNW